MSRAPVIGVMGGAGAPGAALALARELGGAVAREGWTLLNGGRDTGVMAASAEGAGTEGGLVVGILPGADGTGASPHLTVAVVTGLGHARNAVNVLSSDVVVALPGGAGTLSEIALACKTGKPVVLLGWGSDPPAVPGTASHAGTVGEAMERIRERLGQ